MDEYYEDNFLLSGIVFILRSTFTFEEKIMVPKRVAIFLKLAQELDPEAGKIIYTKKTLDIPFNR